MCPISADAALCMLVHLLVGLLPVLCCVCLRPEALSTICIAIHFGAFFNVWGLLSARFYIKREGHTNVRKSPSPLELLAWASGSRRTF